MSDDWDMECPDYSCDVSDDFESLDNCSDYPDSETSQGTTFRDGEVVERLKPCVSSTHIVWPSTKRTLTPRGKANTYHVVEELPNGQKVHTTVTTPRVAHGGLNLPRGKKSTSKVDAVIYQSDCRGRAPERDMRGARYAQRPMTARDDFRPLSDDTVEWIRTQLLLCEDFLCMIEREAQRARARAYKRVGALLTDCDYLRSCETPDIHAPKSAYRRKIPADEVGVLSPNLTAASRKLLLPPSTEKVTRTGQTSGGFLIGETPCVRGWRSKQKEKSPPVELLKLQAESLVPARSCFGTRLPAGITRPVGGFRFHGDAYVFSSLDYRDIETVTDSQGPVFRGRKIQHTASEAAHTIALFRIPDEVDDLFCVPMIGPTVFRPALPCLATRYPHGYQGGKTAKSAEVQVNWVPPMDVQHGLPCDAPDSEPHGRTYGTDYTLSSLRDVYDLRGNTVEFLPLCVNGVWVHGDLSSMRTKYVPYETISGGQRFVHPPREDMLIGGARNPYRTLLGSYGSKASRNKPIAMGKHGPSRVHGAFANNGKRFSFLEIRDGKKVRIDAVTICPAPDVRQEAKYRTAMQNIGRLLCPEGDIQPMSKSCKRGSRKFISRNTSYVPHYLSNLEFRLTGQTIPWVAPVAAPKPALGLDERAARDWARMHGSPFAVEVSEHKALREQQSLEREESEFGDHEGVCEENEEQSSS